MTYLTHWENDYAQNKITENTLLKKLDLLQIFHLCEKPWRLCRCGACLCISHKCQVVTKWQNTLPASLGLLVILGRLCLLLFSLALQVVGDVQCQFQTDRFIKIWRLVTDQSYVGHCRGSFPYGCHGCADRTFLYMWPHVHSPEGQKSRATLLTFF